MGEQATDWHSKLRKKQERNYKSRLDKTFVTGLHIHIQVKSTVEDFYVGLDLANE